MPNLLLLEIMNDDKTNLIKVKIYIVLIYWNKIK